METYPTKKYSYKVRNHKFIFLNLIFLLTLSIGIRINPEVDTTTGLIQVKLLQNRASYQ